MTEQVDKVTGEIFPVAPVQQGGFSVVSFEDAGKAIEYVSRIKREILKEGSDFGTIPGMGDKPCIYKPGMEKLAAFFNLSAEYRTVLEERDPFKDWTYQADEWAWDAAKKKNVKTGRKIEKPTRGYYLYRVSCTLRHRQTGVVWCVAEGECCSVERSKEVSNSNTILKIAQKRAYGAAVLNATFSSSLFTVDIDDAPQDDAPKATKPIDAEATVTTVPPNVQRETASGVTYTWDHSMPSKYGTESDPAYCNHCKKKHVLQGDTVVKYQEKYGAEQCAIRRIESEAKDAVPDQPNRASVAQVKAVFAIIGDLRANKLLQTLPDELYTKAERWELGSLEKSAENASYLIENLKMFQSGGGRPAPKEQTSMPFEDVPFPEEEN